MSLWAFTTPFVAETPRNAADTSSLNRALVCSRTIAAHALTEMVHGQGCQPMLTTEEFHAWCQRLYLAEDTVAMLRTIRSSPPVRKVRGRASNVAGRYPSPKMQRAIQFESQHVELWAIYAMERDETVLEYYDQPMRLPLRYRALSGKHTTQWHTPDFLVLRTTGGAFEEWKPVRALEALAVSMPNRYQHAGEAWAHPLGLGYQVRSSAAYHALYIQNLKFLQD